MSYIARRRRRGFTLTELAIVLAVIGVLAVGLYNLISNANTQSRDSSAASQQATLITAIKGYLNSRGGALSGSGQLFLQNMAANTQTLPLPAPGATSSAGGATCTTNAQVAADFGICNFLPTGFNSGTTNSYGQVYNIRVYNPTPGSAPSTYSFMIMNSGGGTAPVISDTSGARISSLIGGDGGFIYNANVCGAPTSSMVCGAYGAWSTSAIGTYGFSTGGSPTPASGDIASRTFIGLNATATYTWLDRQPMPGDNANTPTWNTMDTNLILGTSIESLAVGALTVSTTGTPNSFFMGSQLSDGAGNWTATGGGTLNVQGGTINMATFNATTGGGTINLQSGSIQGNDRSTISILDNATPLINIAGMPGIINLNTGCTSVTTLSPNTCVPAIQVNEGDINLVDGQVNAVSIYAGTFIYQGSDMRIKSNIRPLADSLDNVMRLKPVSFNFKAGGHPGLGVIAQDVEKIYPQLVTQNPNGVKAVNYDGLIAPLIDSVQELKKENDGLRQQIKDQGIEQQKLEKELKGRPAAAP